MCLYVFPIVFPIVYTYFGYHWVKLSRPLFNAAAIVTNRYSTGHPTSVEHPYVGYKNMQLAIMITRMKVYPMAIFGHYDIMIPCE